MSTPLPPASVPFDARPLTDPIDPVELRAHAQAMRALLRQGTAQNVVAVVIGVFVVVIALFTIIPAIIGGVVLLTQYSSTGGGLVAAIGSLVPVLIIAVVGVAMVLGFRHFSRRGNQRRFRLDRFATANGMHYVARQPDPPLPGMIFQLGRSRAGNDILRGTEPRFVEFGNYQYTTGSGKNATTHNWGYVAIHLDVPLPHIVLDALGNNSLFGSNLPASFSRDQRLDLEGDFNKHFALYCPQGYERDALYLFTPDIMARFVDHAAALDVEIVDDWLFLYGKRELATVDPATWAWLFSTVAALMSKFEQWARWRDDRLQAAAYRTGAASGLPFAAPAQALTPPPGVASEGQRLRRGFSWSVVLVFVVVALWTLTRFLN